MKFEYFPSSELSHSNMTNKIDGKKCRLIDPLKNLNRPETKIFCPRFSHEIKKRKNSKDMNILVSEFSGTPPPPPKTHNEQCSGWGEIYVSWAANASKKPFFFLKIVIFTKSSVNWSSSSYRKTWTLFGRMLSSHEEFLFTMNLYTTHAQSLRWSYTKTILKKPAFADYYSIFPPKVFKLKNNVCVHVSLSSEYIYF